MRARFAAIPHATAGFGAAVDDPRRPAGEHHEHSSTPDVCAYGTYGLRREYGGP